MQVKPKVTLLAHTPEAEKVVAAAAKLCYSSTPASEIMENLTEESAEKFLNMLMSFGHASPIEHASFTFGIEGISRACSHQLVRHRLASFSQKSQRYVTEGAFDYVMPPEIEDDPEAKAVFEDAMQAAQDAYDRLSDILIDRHVKALVASGVDEATALKKAQKQSIEDARFVLPNACETMLVMTMNVRELLHFFNVRCCARAQWEIRDVARQMLKLCAATAPALFKHAGPNCLSGPCPEGNMSCGRILQVREEFKALKENRDGEEA